MRYTVRIRRKLDEKRKRKGIRIRIRIRNINEKVKEVEK